jgi:hypothetical protein
MSSRQPVAGPVQVVVASVRSHAIPAMAVGTFPVDSRHGRCSGRVERTGLRWDLVRSGSYEVQSQNPRSRNYHLAAGIYGLAVNRFANSLRSSSRSPTN